MPELIAECARADETAWSEFFRRFHPRIVFLAARAARRPPGGRGESCAELVQEVYVRLLAHDCRALRCWRGTSEQSLLCYLATIVHAVSCDATKRRQSRKRSAPLLSLDGERRDDSSLADLLPAPGSVSPEHALGERLVPDRIRDLLARVERGPQAGRNSVIFMLHALDGLTASEIARLPGFEMSTANVESVLRRTKERLRAELGTPANL